MRIPFSLRQLVLAVFVVGSLGLLAELILLEHIESWQQWIPVVMLSVGVIGGLGMAWRRGRAPLMAFRALMVVFVATGALGMYYHLAGNVEFALERDSSLTGLALLWKAMRGATPSLAPGAIAQLGLLGLLSVLPERLTERERTPEGNSLD